MTRKNTKEFFIKKANFIHNYKYDYSKVIYINNRTKVIIICNSHGEFLQSPDNHMRKRGCPGCKSRKAKLTRDTLENFKQKANKIHLGKYSYSNSHYINSATKIIITCPKHGNFSQTPNNHLSGRGCRRCGGSNKKTTSEFIQIANSIHNHKYDYSKVEYKKAHSKIIIICSKHGEFLQTPGAHINQKQGCAKCSNWMNSKPEKQWLDYINLPKKYRQKTIIINKRKFIVDGLDPKTNTVYEFYGDYWHGNPKIYNLNNIHPLRKCTYGELYRKTIDKEMTIKNAGYGLITMWENDWKILQ